MPRFGVDGTVVTILFENVPRKRGFLIFGEERVPAAAVAAAQVILTSIGLAAGLHWPDRAKPFIKVQPGLSVDEVVANVARELETEMTAAESVAPALKVWAVAEVEGSMIRTNAWYPFKNLHIIAPYAYAAGTAAGIHRSDSEAWLKSWLNGIGNAWDNAVEAGLAVEKAAPSYESLLRSVDDLLALAGGEEPVDEPPPSWQVLEHLWRFETSRIVLLAMGSIGWREPEQEKYRGILY